MEKIVLDEETVEKVLKEYIKNNRGIVVDEDADHNVGYAEFWLPELDADEKDCLPTKKQR